MALKTRRVAGLLRVAGDVAVFGLAQFYMPIPGEFGLGAGGCSGSANNQGLLPLSFRV